MIPVIKTRSEVFESGVTRRRLLATGLLVSVGRNSAGATSPNQGARGSAEDPVAVLVDLTRCIGYRACENACLLGHGQSGLAPLPTGAGYAPGEGTLCFKTRTFIDERGVQDASGKTRSVPVKRQCMHCLEPACVQGCPTGALKYGKRPALLREARARRHAHPTRYSDLYGDEVVGGTSWIDLSDVPMTQIGFRKDLPNFPLPSYTWKTLSRLPFVVVAVGFLVGVIYRFRSRSARGD